MSSDEEPVVSSDAESENQDSDDEPSEEKKPVKAKRVRKKKGKKKKDPSKPKRNMSAFFLYSTATRKTVKEENPNLSFGDLVSLSI